MIPLSIRIDSIELTYANTSPNNGYYITVIYFKLSMLITKLEQIFNPNISSKYFYVTVWVIKSEE